MNTAALPLLAAANSTGASICAACKNDAYAVVIALGPAAMNSKAKSDISQWEIEALFKLT